MKNQIIDSFIINPDALNSEEDKQKLETEISNMCSDMALVQAMANDENVHGPMNAEAKKDIVQDIARDLSSLLEEKDSLKAIFVIAVNDDNQFRSIHAGELPALTRIVVLTGVESMKLAQSLAADIRKIDAETQQEADESTAAGDGTMEGKKGA